MKRQRARINPVTGLGYNLRPPPRRNPAMRFTKTFLALSISTAVLTGCKKPETAAPSEPTPMTELPVAQSAPSTLPTESNSGFDINSVPVSSIALGDFPYLNLPSGYTSTRDFNKDFARFPFWVNSEARWIEGKFHGSTFYPERGREFSQHEVQRNFDALITQMGGRKLSEGTVPKQQIDAWGDEITQGFINGLGNVWGDPVQIYLIRRADGNIWVHLVLGSASGAYTIGQEKSFDQTAHLLSASELKKQIDSAGKAALQVNFATDKTDILPDSIPQIEQVASLLMEDPAMKLAINGHTDSTGNTAHNRQLSEGRAKSVMAALESRGIAADRLSAQGHGDTQPVADNATEAGKAKNRRVELVKR